MGTRQWAGGAKCHAPKTFAPGQSLAPCRENGWVSAYLDGEIILNLIECPCCCKSVDSIHGKFFLPPWYHAVVISKILCGEDQSKVRKVACLGHLDPHGLGCFGECLDLACRLVSFVVEDDFLIDADCDFLNGDFLGLAQPVWVGAQFDVDGDRVQWAVTPARQTDSQCDEMIRHPFGAFRTIVHAKRGESVVTLYWDGERILFLLLWPLLQGNDEFVEGLGGTTGELQARGGHSSSNFLASAAVWDKDDKRQVHG